MYSCSVCGKDFEARRNDAKYCSPKCRVEASRAVKEPSKEPTPDSSVNLNPSDRFINGLKVQIKFPDDPEKQRNYEGFLKQIPAIEWLSTNTRLDELTRLPKDKITLLYGRYGVGKTTLAHLIASKSALKTLYVDTEASLTPDRLAELGIQANRFDIKRVGFVEDVYDLLHNEATLKKYDLIVWDSVANTSARTEYESDSTDRLIGAKALIMNKLMRILPLQLDKFKTTLLLINQERDGIGMYAENYIPGGKGQLYSSSVVIRLTGRYPKIKAEITKSRVSDIGKLEFSL